MNLGKTYYKSSTLTSIRLLISLVVILLIYNIYHETFHDPDFIERGLYQFNDVLEFHLMYPETIILFGLLILGPAHYYGFYRGTVFKEKGIIHNRGIPFWNKKHLYNDIKEFKIINPKDMIALVVNGDYEYFILTSDINRVISLLDQHGVKSNLDQTKYRNAIHFQKRIVTWILLVGLCVYFMQYFGVARILFRLKIP
jgi:hypothetical protein